jgi:protein-S-isoprenylcysteine O-methyltransferase Ste14
MNSEEALLQSEFGERYADYRRRTWRLVPFLY